jgi:hypothetical protein
VQVVDDQKAAAVGAGALACAFSPACHAAVNGAIEDTWDNWFSQAKPKGCPTGTLPIDKTTYSKQHQRIKKGVGAGPADWTGITPDGDVITSDESGNAVNNGPVQDYLP